jgi:hypothetical protein
MAIEIIDELPEKYRRLAENATYPFTISDTIIESIGWAIHDQYEQGYQAGFVDGVGDGYMAGMSFEKKRGES